MGDKTPGKQLCTALAQPRLTSSERLVLPQPEKRHSKSREASEEGREEKQDDEDNKKTLGAIIWCYFYY